MYFLGSDRYRSLMERSERANRRRLACVHSGFPEKLCLPALIFGSHLLLVYVHIIGKAHHLI